ncbi:DUF6456 domain-containing protein [Phyllobacterium sp. YR531]|uniref:DUF6456 domain-containing protein n=1 Tax=Phyllobacterium sp. YR531 TaxID=1144343 RepID=UPI00026F8777|nr:DUF6456 domain-containing protein [Phyllobacterium sp. YR531]EJN01377.1 hypothetical protein PMI41_03459 [Phyllobacterium sp. YR531]
MSIAMPPIDNAMLARLLRFLAKGPAQLVETATPGKMALESAAHGVTSAKGIVIIHAKRVGLLACSKAELSITDAGRAWLRRQEAGVDAFAGQHRRDGFVLVHDENGPSKVRANEAESPLSNLRKRKDAAGRPLISEVAFMAGEQLRQDFTLGNLMPSTGVNWNATGSGSHANGVLEITDAALAARQRVERALNAVGPELSGVLIDICCFLKGLEMVERERQWPVRSAKLILKTALAMLDRHYNPPAPARRGSSIIHWGTADYRPTM